mgnify:CR=1 FL=1
MKAKIALLGVLRGIFRKLYVSVRSCLEIHSVLGVTARHYLISMSAVSQHTYQYLSSISAVWLSHQYLSSISVVSQQYLSSISAVSQQYLGPAAS